MHQDARQRCMLDDVGKVARVKGMTVIHRALLPPRRGRGKAKAVYATAEAQTALSVLEYLAVFAEQWRRPRAGPAIAADALPAARSRALGAAHPRHHHLIAPPGPAVDLGATVEFEVLGKADPHLVEPLAVATDRDGLMGETRIGRHEGVLALLRRHR